MALHWRCHEFINTSYQIRPLPGARELLIHCAQSDIKHAIATSADRDSVQHMLKILDISPQFPIVTCDDVPDSKPHPGLFLAAARRLDCSISQCVIVGDTVWDQLAARQASTLSVAVLTGGYTEDELRERDLLVPNYPKLPDWGDI